jgi:glycosyltransferase involved in cell wall biosynthesis
MEATTLCAAGWEVSIICPTGKAYEAHHEVVENVHIYRHDLPAEGQGLRGYAREYASALWNEFRLARRIWRERPFDVVHICNPPDLLFLVAGWHKAVHGARVIFDQHDIMPELYEAKFGRRDWGYAAMRLAERLTFATADIVISTNQSYQKVALTRGRKRPAAVFVVRSAPDLQRFCPTEPETGFHRGRPHLVGYVGVMGPQEGLDHLLRAIDLIVRVSGRKDISFMLVGDGPSLASLRKMTHELGLDDYVEFPGRVPDDELIRRLCSCDLCVNPDPKNPFNDSSSMNKILEYMSLGKAIVQFDLKEDRHSAADASVYALPNDNADLAQKLMSCVDDPDACAAMGQAGIRRMSGELEWRHQVPQLMHAYDALPNRAGRVRP